VNLTKYIASLACTFAIPAVAQSAAISGETAQLFETIAQLDAKMFAAFNAHDVDGVMSMFSDDVEFYHDKGGLTNHQQTRQGFVKMFGSASDIRRELIPGSLQVYPIKDFGALEIGTHRFCHKEKEKNGSPPRTDCGNFPFVMIWQKMGDSWKVSRVISYGH
jgi:ketosteroid isomerase-like protein